MAEKVSIITNIYGDNGGEQLPLNLKDKLCLMTDGKCYVNNAFLDDNDVVQLLSLWKESNLLKELIYESSAEIKARYDLKDKTILNTSLVQKEIKDLLILHHVFSGHNDIFTVFIHLSYFYIFIS
jgi:hypothetical protein